jgi:hypothetical protein
MQVISRNRSAKRLLLLFTLAGAMFYLRTPTTAQATGTCQYECRVLYSNCTALCLEAHAPEFCYTTCTNNYNECIKSCS